VLELIATGLSNREIADELVVSEATVKTHVGRILSKLDARDNAQLVVFAYETGLVIPDHHSRWRARAPGCSTTTQRPTSST